jgi:hypothetical protein
MERNEYGTPLISSMFTIAQNVSTNEILCYANSDIIFINDLTKTVKNITIRPFLMVGQRTDIDINYSIDFKNPEWENQLGKQVSKEGILLPPYGIDYFVFVRGMYNTIPPFAVGRPGWDNWMIYWARHEKIPVIDSTKVVTAIHQNHNYLHHPQDRKGVFKGPEAVMNIGLLGSINNGFTVKDATHTINQNGIKPALSLQYLSYRLRAIPALDNRFRYLTMLFRLPYQVFMTLDILKRRYLLMRKHLALKF